MWTHYSKRHTGIYLAFDVADDMVLPVEYPRRRLSLIKWKGSEPPEELKNKLLTTKFADWTYEKERRIIVPLTQLNQEVNKGKELFFRPFDNDLKLAEIIAGPKCSIQWRPCIIDAIEALSGRPRLVKAGLAFRKFEVATQKHQDSPEKGFRFDGYWEK
jgi:hypothetical protein